MKQTIEIDVPEGKEAVWDGDKAVGGKPLHGLKRYFMRCNFGRYDYSRMKWFKHKNR